MRHQSCCGRLSLKKNSSFTHRLVSFHSQLQTPWFDKFRRFIWVVLRVILFCPAVLQILFINIIVGRGFASKYACKEIILRLHQSETVAGKGKLEGGAYKNVGGG